jgi:hypothetical protein
MSDQASVMVTDGLENEQLTQSVRESRFAVQPSWKSSIGYHRRNPLAGLLFGKPNRDSSRQIRLISPTLRRIE